MNAVMAACQTQKEKHSGLLLLLCRIVLYSTVLFLVVSTVSSHALQLSFFTLFSAAIELSLSCAHSGKRYWIYILCVTGIVVSGICAASHAEAYRAACAKECTNE